MIRDELLNSVVEVLDAEADDEYKLLVAILQLGTCYGCREQLKTFERMYHSINSVMDSTTKAIQGVDPTNTEVTPAKVPLATTPTESPAAPRVLVDDLLGTWAAAQGGTPPESIDRTPPPGGLYYFKNSLSEDHHECLEAHHSNSAYLAWTARAAKFPARLSIQMGYRATFASRRTVWNTISDAVAPKRGIGFAASAARLPPLQTETTPLQLPAPLEGPRKITSGWRRYGGWPSRTSGLLHGHFGGSHSPVMECLQVLEHPAAPPADAPPRAANWQLPPGGGNPTSWVPDHESHDKVPGGSVSHHSELPTNLDVSPVNLDNYRAITIPLTICLPFAFSWLAGDAEWAIWSVLNSHGHEWPKFHHCSGGLLPGAHEGLIRAWLIWSDLPIPSNLRPAVKRAKQLLVPQPRPGTYGNAVVARRGAGTARRTAASASSGSSSSSACAAICAQPRP